MQRHYPFLIIFLLSLFILPSAFALNPFQGDSNFKLIIEEYDTTGNLFDTHELVGWYDTAGFTYTYRTGEIVAKYKFWFSQDMTPPAPSDAATLRVNVTIYGIKPYQVETSYSKSSIDAMTTDFYITIYRYDWEFYEDIVHDDQPLTYMAVVMWWENATGVPVGEKREYVSPHWLVYPRYATKGIVEDIFDTLKVLDPTGTLQRIDKLLNAIPTPFTFMELTYSSMWALLNNFFARMESVGLSWLEQYLIVAPASILHRNVALMEELGPLAILVLVAELVLYYLGFAFVMWVLDHIPVIG